MTYFRAKARQLLFRFEWTMSGRLRRLYRNEPARLLLDQFRGMVAGGPFKGMKYLSSAAGSALAPKIAGTYELELHSVIESLTKRGYQTIIDIGAAEGYYAIGFAMRIPNAQVIAYDTDPKARQLLAELADLNQRSSAVDIRDECHHESLVVSDRTLIICDIEGGERSLLDPEKAKDLHRADILVEVHDDPGETDLHETLSHRFSQTHELETISAIKRDPAELGKALWVREPAFLRGIFDERRVRGLNWLFMTSRSQLASQGHARTTSEIQQSNQTQTGIPKC